jgi:hypothetical protein
MAKTKYTISIGQKDHKDYFRKSHFFLFLYNLFLAPKVLLY